ncbi:MAG: hypothetical protein J6V36_02185, partial [Clostridia bacterium]|nr:hypothetical protein [Clostridia bacterium]
MNRFNKVSDEDKKKIEQIINVALNILTLTRNKLLINMRFLDMALSELDLEPEPISTIATNGKTIFFNPLYVIHQYVSNGKDENGSLTRDFLHILMHCIFKHNSGSVIINRRIWNLSCDIAVEASIDNLIFDFLETEKGFEKQQIINKLKGQINPKTKKKLSFLTAEKLYRFFIDSEPKEKDLEALERLFKADDHFLWYRTDSNDFGGEGFVLNRDENGKIISISSDGIKYREKKFSSYTEFITDLEERWAYISERMKVDMDTISKTIGDTAGNLFQNLCEVTREKYDYTSFLKKFAVMGETMKLNHDEFDYIYYTYGMKLYKKMPLIEPLEYKEVKQIKEFAIIIDTSGS